MIIFVLSKIPKYYFRYKYLNNYCIFYYFGTNNTFYSLTMERYTDKRALDCQKRINLSIYYTKIIEPENH